MGAGGRLGECMLDIIIREGLALIGFNGIVYIMLC